MNQKDMARVAELRKIIQPQQDPVISEGSEFHSLRCGQATILCGDYRTIEFVRLAIMLTSALEVQRQPSKLDKKTAPAST